MNIDDQVNNIVQNVVAEITTKIQAQALDAITKQVADAVNSIDLNALVSDRLNQLLGAKVNQLPIDTKTIESSMSTRVEELAQNLYTTVQNKSVDIATNTINSYVSKIDFYDLCQTTLLTAMTNSTFTFPKDSIPAAAVQKNGFILSGDNIVGGIIKNFGSTGIDDKATDCRLTILDEITVVENNLLTKDLTVKGSTIIEGDLTVSGSVDATSPFYLNLVTDATNNIRTGLNAELFQSFSDILFQQIRTHGLDLTKLTFGGKTIIDGQSLNNEITQSNLQKVGTLRELQVTGEVLLSQSLYTTTKRVGVNTIEPSQALSVWDEEIEVGIGKLSNNKAVIGTPRSQTLVVSSNGKDNLVLTPDGAVEMNTIKLGHVSLASSLTPPADTRPKGAIVFNANPSVGGPLGWVSLGNAQWANFGIID